MSDPASALRPALEAWLRADAGVIAAFGSKPVKVYTALPPVNVAAPYLIVDGFEVLDDSAECLDATEVTVSLDVWSLTNPPGYAEAEAMAGASKASLLAIPDSAFALSSFRVVAAQAHVTRYLTDPSDGKTVHAVVTVTLSVDPTV